MGGQNARWHAGRRVTTGWGLNLRNVISNGEMLAWCWAFQAWQRGRCNEAHHDATGYRQQARFAGWDHRAAPTATVSDNSSAAMHHHANASPRQPHPRRYAIGIYSSYVLIFHRPHMMLCHQLTMANIESYMRRKYQRHIASAYEYIQLYQQHKCANYNATPTRTRKLQKYTNMNHSYRCYTSLITRNFRLHEHNLMRVYVFIRRTHRHHKRS